MSIHIRDLKLHGVDEAALLQEQAFIEGARRGEGLSDDKTEKLLPNREQFAVVYRYFREQKGWNYGLDVFIFSFRAKDTFRCSVLNFRCNGGIRLSYAADQRITLSDSLKGNRR